MSERIAVIGSGYVGLVTGTCFAESGHQVHCVDTDTQLISRLQQGQIPIHEPQLSEMVLRNVQRGRLFFTSSHAESLKNATFAFIAVDTPANEDGSANLDRISRVVDQLAPFASPSLIIVLKSTVPVGTAAAFQTQLEGRGKSSIEVVSNPEFLREGAAIYDFLNPARVVIGAKCPKARERVASLYRPLVKSADSLLLMDNKSAELSKYACNGMLAAKISYMNAVATLCEKMGVDVRHIQRVMTTDDRIGGYISPGIGFGGSCFPKDVRALTHVAKGLNCPHILFEEISAINDFQRDWMFRSISRFFGENRLTGLRVAIWGLAFKPNTDDIREAPSLNLIRSGLEAGLRFQVYDPVAMPRVKNLISDTHESIFYAENPYQAAEGMDCLAICTEWASFSKPDLQRLKTIMRSPVVFDGRNSLSPLDVKEAGFQYRGVGIPS